MSARSHGCTFGCGNEYDYVLTVIEDASTLFLCLPCFVALAAKAVEAVTDGITPEEQNTMAELYKMPPAPVTVTEDASFEGL